MDTHNPTKEQEKVMKIEDTDLHRMCDRDIVRLGRENEDLKAQLAALQLDLPRSDDKPRMTLAQRNTLWRLCAGYNVPFREDDYYLYPADSSFCPGYVEGWIGGRAHAPNGIERTTIEVGVDRDGRSNS